MNLTFGIYYVFLVFVIVFNCATASAQSYGLQFASNEVVQDKRTALDLTPKETICFKESFELSFDLSFLPDQPAYFGYIFRLIDNKKRNIDLVYNNSSRTNNFTFVIGDRSTNLSFDIYGTALFKKWNRIILRFDYKNQTLTAICGAEKSSQKISIDRNICFKILFGANDFGEFQTTDVPPMRVRNIQIHEGRKLKYKWALNETTGNTVQEEVSKKNGLVRHPLWIKKMHYDWKLLKKFTAEGPASVAFDSKNARIYVVGLESLSVFSAINNQLSNLKYTSGRLNLLPGNQSYFDSRQRKLYNLYVDQGLVASFNFKTLSWDSNYKFPESETDKWHFNKFYSSSDSSFYIFGGYGHFVYKNETKRYHLPSKTWQTIKPEAKNFIPRYLAALGHIKDGAYILGGYGSKTGQQINNPKNLYELLYFNIKDKSFKKEYELKVSGKDFVFANSLVIDEKTRSYYGLIFPKHKFNSTLQLMKGSLDSTSFNTVGDIIPYKFYDINSFSDLYYSPVIDKFIAVTLFFDNKDQTEIAIYSLDNPPLETDSSEYVVDNNSIRNSIILFFIAVATALLFYYLRRRNKKIKSESVIPGNVLADIKSEITTEPRNTILITDPDRQRSDVHKTITEHDKIFLFGDFQLFDSEGNDITKHFTPLVKELFLVILLYTIRWERGLSSEKLKELLWFDKTTESARNNRSVNIAKLKAILEKMKYCQVSKETGYWKINIDYEYLQIDYRDYLNIVQDKKNLNKQKIESLADILQRGTFLSNLDYEWLDPFKSEISNEVIDIYQHFANSIDISEDPEFIIKIASSIFYFDPVNEEAMILKCKALVYLGKHSLAKSTFEHFNKEYKAIYGEEFGKDFHAILE